MARGRGERVYASRWYDKAVIFLAMASSRVATRLAGCFHAASLAELEENQMMIVHGADRPVLLCRHEGQVFALDNRCPHMGFPLSKGSLDYGLLTCHWHHVRFDLAGPEDKLALARAQYAAKRPGFASLQEGEARTPHLRLKVENASSQHYNF